MKPHYQGHALTATAGATHAGGERRNVALLDIHDYVDAGDCGDLPDLERCLNEAHENVERAFERLVTEEAKRSFEETTP